MFLPILRLSYSLMSRSWYRTDSFNIIQRSNSKAIELKVHLKDHSGPVLCVAEIPCLYLCFLSDSFAHVISGGSLCGIFLIKKSNWILIWASHTCSVPWRGWGKLIFPYCGSWKFHLQRSGCCIARAECHPYDNLLFPVTDIIWKV